MKAVRYLIWGLILAAAAGFGWKWWQGQQKATLPTGIVAGNGRVESIQVDVAAKYGGRVEEIFAKEGDLVTAGQVLVTIDTDELEAELSRGKPRSPKPTRMRRRSRPILSKPKAN